MGHGWIYARYKGRITVPTSQSRQGGLIVGQIDHVEINEDLFQGLAGNKAIVIRIHALEHCFYLLSQGLGKGKWEDYKVRSKVHLMRTKDRMTAINDCSIRD